MAQQKTTQAVIKHARLNPVTSAEDKAALEIIDQLEADGYNFKQIAVDAILRVNGMKPEMFARPNPQNMMADMEDMLSRFAQEIVTAVKHGSVQPESESISESDSPFSRNFAKSFMQRNQRAMGDEE